MPGVPNDHSQLVYTRDGQNSFDSGAVVTGAAASISVTLPATVGLTQYLTHFSISGGGATVGSLVTATVTGLVGGTISIVIAVPAGATLGITPIVFNYSRPVPAAVANAAIVLTLPSLGAGNTAAAVNIRGFLA